MMYDHLHNEATPGTRSKCGLCDGDLLAKCGQIVTWHWAHVAADCDPWAEPESQWHINWKRWFEMWRGARVEVPIGRHRADVVLPSGQVVELQSSYLSVGSIITREEFYGEQMAWIYRAHWMDRVHFGEKGGFWWKQGSKAMTEHERRTWWDDGHNMMRVQLNLVDHVDWENDRVCERVLGRVLEQRCTPDIRARPAPTVSPPPVQLSLLDTA